MNLKRCLLGLTIFAVAVFGLAGCGTGEKTASNVWRVGTDASYAPFGFQDEKLHEYVGFDIDIIRAIAETQGHEVAIKNLNFDGLIPALQTGDLDIAISDMTINEERAKTVDFTDSYYKAGLSMVVRADETRINSFDDLEGLRVGVTIGSTGAEAACADQPGGPRHCSQEGQCGTARPAQCRAEDDQGERKIRGDLPQVVRKGAAGEMTALG